MKGRFTAAVLTTVLVASTACVGDDPVAGATPTPSGDGGAPTPGTTCGPGNACATGTCVDGFCCDTACDGICEACNVPGKEGKCSPIKGAPRRGACDGDATGPCAGSCDGTKGASCTYPEVACGTGSCAAGVASLPATCKAGKCGAPDTQTCALGCFEDTCLGVKQVTAGYYFTCAVLTDKKVRCWGDNASGQVAQPSSGTPSTDIYKTPKEVGSLSNVVMVAATFSSACALIGDGSVKCWGSNTSGQLGLPADAMAHYTPTTVAGITGATFLSGSSGGSFCAIVAGGAIKCWGANGSGQLGIGTTSTSESTPVTVCAPGSTSSVSCTPASGATFVAGGDNHRCALFAGGQVACWGSNNSGEVGVPASAAQPFPVNVPGLTATHLTAGNQLTCAAVTGGGAKCWGANFSGRLGNGTDTGTFSTPVSVCTKQDCSTLLSGVTAVTTYDESSCALAGGAVKCWGINTNGQLGDGNASASQSYAATTAIASGAVAVASGGGANYAIVVDRANRDLRCWGSEGYNQCGDGTATPPGGRKTPIAPKW